MVAILLAIKHHSSAGDAHIRPRNSSGQGRAGALQSLRYGSRQPAPYDRIATFGDASTPGKTFVLILSTVSESESAFSYVNKGNHSVGDYYIIVEPDHPVRLLQDCPIITTNKPIIPLLRPTQPIVVNLTTPLPGNQRYFLITGTNVTLSKVSAEKACCTGVFCDRQAEVSRSSHCGCLYTGHTANLVLRMNVRFRYIDDSNNAPNVYTVTNFRSLRTSALFLMPFTLSTDTLPYLQQEDNIREAVRNINAYINGNGGWTICGWYRRGEVVDASATADSAQIASANKPIHISMLYATNHGALDATQNTRFLPTPLNNASANTGQGGPGNEMIHHQ